MPLFASLPNAVLELKTKSDWIANLEGLEHRGRTVVSWSVNSRRICAGRGIESGESSRNGIGAARRVQQWGYRVGFHFDPIVHYEGWEQEYRQAIGDIFAVVDPSRVAWVSLGALRFTPQAEGDRPTAVPEIDRFPTGNSSPHTTVNCAISGRSGRKCMRA